MSQTTETPQAHATPAGYNPVRDEDGQTVYYQRHAEQYAHIFTEQLICVEDYGPEVRYYVGIHEDKQPMTFAELSRMVADLLEFYGKAAADHHASRPFWDLVQDKEIDGSPSTVWHGPRNEYVKIYACTQDPDQTPNRGDIVYEVENWADATAEEVDAMLTGIQEFKDRHVLGLARLVPARGGAR